MASGAAIALALAGCGHSGTVASSTGLRLQREDLIATAQALTTVEARVAGEAAATRTAWPLVANGLPRKNDTAQPLLDAAAGQAEALKLPGLFEERKAATLTGAASGIAGLFRGSDTLAARGWRMIAASVREVDRGPSAAAAFAEANVALYIDSVYDAQFGLAQVGKRLRSAYAKLGGPAAFGAALTQTEVDRLAAAYSEPAIRLHPHASVKLGS
jgi:hypothetical protein